MKIRKLTGIALAITLAVSSAVSGYGAGAKDTVLSTAETGSAAETEEAAESEVLKEAEEIAAEDISVTWEDSRVYMDLTLGKYDSITTYGIKGYEDVPFISVHDYLDLLCEGRARITAEDGVIKISMNGSSAVIDPAADTVLFENPARFRSAGDVDGAIVEDSEYNVITRSVKNQSVQTEAEPLLISLKDYHMPVVAYEDTVLMPFLALQNIFGSITMTNVLAYNGRDYYNAFEASDFLLDEKHADAKDSPYIKAAYGGPFSELEETTQAYADYGYYSICLLLDLTFGHKEEKNITTFDEYFTRMKAKPSMCSTDPSSAMMAEFLLFNYLFDSGHDSMFSEKNVFGMEGKTDISKVDGMADDIIKSEERKELFEQQKADDKNGAEDPSLDAILGAFMEKGLKMPEIAPLLFWSYYMEGKRPEDYKEEQLDYAGDTAVIYFNKFEDDTDKRKPSYYLDPIKEEDAAENTFAFFYQCFKDIQEHGDIKNVVINLSDNGGGNAAALVSVLGFLSEDGEVKITNRDMMAGNYREEYYHVDTNLDGIADDQDGFGRQYRFYIMCSGYSYSCANALPYFAQKEGLARIIGTKPGGGDCVVASFIDAYGRCAYYSGLLKLGTDDGTGFVSNEEATEPDLNMMPSILDIGSVPWFDPEGIAEAVHACEAGQKEMSYNAKTEAEKMTDFLNRLLEKVSQPAETE